jgi:hypothetical protein
VPAIEAEKIRMPETATGRAPQRSTSWPTNGMNTP